MDKDNKPKEEECSASAEATADKEKQDIEECQKQRDEYLAGWQRSRADFLNYKKEEMERIAEILKYAGEELILKLLPILDNFEKAVKEMPEQGFLQIQKQFHDFLKKCGVEEIESLGQKFDPNFHEAIEEIEPASAEALAGKSGIIIEEVKKGYKLNGRVIRPAKVKVSK